MGAKVEMLKDQDGNPNCWMFFCPGCHEYHSFDLVRWKFNGDVEKPTFNPSLLVNATFRPETRCHLFVRDGKIIYLRDCHHSMAGQTVEMEDIEKQNGTVVG